MLSALDQSRQSAVFARMREGILNGLLPGGSRLPPSRALAQELGVARQTVVLAYERLAAEGYVQARTGAGTFVTTSLPDARPALALVPASGSARLSRRGAAIAALPAGAGQGGGTLLAPGIPAAELFPTRAWAGCMAAALRADAMRPGYPDPQGLPALRTEIAAHLAVVRGVLTRPDCILVTAGTQQAMRIAAEILLDPGDIAWVEDPGYIAGRGSLCAAGAVPVAVPSDEAGLNVAAGVALAPGARLALVAPSHSTPRGSAMPVRRRLALLDWAAASDAWVLEDDCDAEFRWTGKPLPPLATLDRAGRVIYCGTFSKTLAPGLRIGFAVLPEPLVSAAVRARTLMDRGPGTMTQAMLAEFMRRGLLQPHVRRMRTEYARRRNAVLDALARHCPRIEPAPAPGGLHMVLRLPDGVDEAATVRAAMGLGLSVAPFARYFTGPSPHGGLVVGFASTPPALATDAARRLAHALNSVAPQ